MKIKVTAWAILAFVGLASHEIIDVFIRPAYGKGTGTLSFLLGIAPNFLAAALIFPFCILTFRDHYTSDSQKLDITNLNRWFWLELGISQLGLVIWEFIQIDSNYLRFDSNDIIATLVGGIIAILIFSIIKPIYLKEKNG